MKKIRQSAIETESDAGNIWESAGGEQFDAIFIGHMCAAYTVVCKMYAPKR